MATPTIIFVPGFWEGPTIFDTVASTLNAQGYDTAYAPIASTGHASPGNPTILDDIQQIRRVIEPHVLAGQEVVLVCHSSGGCMGSAAIKDLDYKTRRARGEKGGVVKLVFLTAGILPQGDIFPDILPFHDIQGSKMFCLDPMTTLMNDLPSDVGKSWAAKLQCQPAVGWADVVEYGGWADVPSVYLICKKDAATPIEMQMQFAEIAGSVVESCEAGHMVMLSQPQTVADFVRRAAEGIREEKD